MCNACHLFILCIYHIYFTETTRHWQLAHALQRSQSMKPFMYRYNILHWFLIKSCLQFSKVYLVQVRLKAEVLCTPSSARLGFELMTSRSCLHTSCHWDACSNHLAISDFVPNWCWFMYLISVDNVYITMHIALFLPLTPPPLAVSLNMYSIT